MEVISVALLNNYIKSLIDKDSLLKNVLVSGELSNFTNHFKSGHFYFSLKDEKAVVKAVMFKSSASNIKFIPKDGMKVIVSARVSVFERDGIYQLYVEDMQPDGLGALHLAFEQLKEKLLNEGLFSEQYKKQIPKFPRKIGIATAKTGAAIQDMINIISRRYPIAEIYLIPVLVQGVDAPSQLIKAIELFNDKNCVDVIIIGRGGGSLEDLWAFNDERLARTIFNSKIPIISAVGHEVDFTISDFVADLRAPTPSAAAELVVPDRLELMAKLQSRLAYLRNGMIGGVERRLAYLENIKQKRCLQTPLYTVELETEKLDHVVKLLTQSMRLIYGNKLSLLSNYAAKLDALSPLKVLSRGYSVTLKENIPLYSIKNVEINDNINIKLADGNINAVVKSVSKGNNNE